MQCEYVFLLRNSHFNRRNVLYLFRCVCFVDASASRIGIKVKAYRFHWHEHRAIHKCDKNLSCGGIWLLQNRSVFFSIHIHFSISSFFLSLVHSSLSHQYIPIGSRVTNNTLSKNPNEQQGCRRRQKWVNPRNWQFIQISNNNAQQQQKRGITDL